MLSTILRLTLIVMTQTPPAPSPSNDVLSSPVLHAVRMGLSPDSMAAAALSASQASAALEEIAAQVQQQSATPGAPDTTADSEDSANGIGAGAGTSESGVNALTTLPPNQAAFALSCSRAERAGLPAQYGAVLKTVGQRCRAAIAEAAARRTARTSQPRPDSAAQYLSSLRAQPDVVRATQSLNELRSAIHAVWQSAAAAETSDAR